MMAVTSDDDDGRDCVIDRRTVLAAAAATGLASLVERPAAAAPGATPFPAGFLWGAATAGHQVEGNNVNADVWAMEQAHPTVYAQPSGDAANSFLLWRTDLDLVKAMGLTSYRFSLEWARIEPAPGEFSIAMLDHYKAIIEGCRARGLVPVVTFNHFTTPIWFAAQGGWTHPQAPARFARYCETAARHLAAQIGYATTLNEPNLSGLLDIVLPGDIGKRLLEADRAMQEAAAREHGVARFLPGNPLYVADPQAVQAGLLAGHRAGRDAIKAVRGDLPVGVSLAIIDDQAAGPNSLRDAMRAKLYRPWLEAARGNDFVGVQNYERAIWTDKGRLPAPAGAPTNDAGSEIYPPSLAGAVRYAHQVSGVPVIVTEHGVNAADDTKRVQLIPAALRELARAMAEGVPVLGYFHWSLVDNFEWVFGYKPQFGLHTLDRQTFARTPKPSVGVLGAIARANAV
jgi:beta-glucosidase